MDVNDALTRLDLHQSMILRHIGRAVTLVEGDPVGVRESLARARWRLARMLREYQVFKHSEIFGPAMLHGASDHAHRARAMADRCTANGAKFDRYLQYWSSRDVIGEWAAYRPGMLAMADMLRGGLSDERRDVVMLFAGSARTRALHG